MQPTLIAEPFHRAGWRILAYKTADK